MFSFVRNARFLFIRLFPSVLLYKELINNKFEGVLCNSQFNTNATYWMINIENQVVISKT
ncbi:hypothetical protein DVR12_18260 [Chitinophaga silvatica]|uniref:Uncharacterized protein n=1 Tax=Chitinophaga silvatica TaxID=2282649 RepID=A0A3E1Y6D5_9BACT|nr:hypothetical protein DVR12_18260 [Chitinophaga silvatica]